MSLLFPARRPGDRIEGKNAGIRKLVPHQHHQAVHKDGRRATAKVAGDDGGRHFDLPLLLPRQVITEQPARPEVHHDSLSIRSGRGSGRAPFRLVKALDLLGRRRAAPGFAAVRPSIRDGVQLPVFERGEDKVIARDDG